jgi:3-hydroxyisobutyrate dehydrogenase-like beta-hydroxyacid dehydrogenase
MIDRDDLRGKQVSEQASGDVVVCLLGLGEAGGSIGADLVARGIAVRAWDPDPARQLPGAVIAGSLAEAVDGSDVVLSINSASAARGAAEAAAGSLRPGQIYADLNSGSPALKRAVADVVAPTGVRFVDAALMDGVPGRGIGTRCLVSGPGAEAFVARFAPLGMPVQAIGAEPGEAASRKLLRSVFAKGLAAAAEEAMRAGEAASCDEWLHGEIARMLEAADGALLDRLLEGTRRHAARRLREMEDVSELLRALAIEPRVTASAIAYLREMSQGQELTIGEGSTHGH